MAEVVCPGCDRPGDPFDEGRFLVRGIYPETRYPLRECSSCGTWVVMRRRLFRGIEIRAVPEEGRAVLERHWRRAQEAYEREFGPPEGAIRVRCGVCGRRYQSYEALHAHRHEVHGIDPPSDPSGPADEHPTEDS